MRKQAMLDRAILSRIAEDLEGTCQTLGVMIEKHNLSITSEDLEDALLDMNIERCPGCGWWMESCELVNDDGDVVGCPQCRKNEAE